MTIRSIREELLKYLEKLSPEEQDKLLGFARSLLPTRDGPKGRSGKDLLAFGGSIGRHEMAAIAKTIEEDCERTDTSAW